MSYSQEWLDSGSRRTILAEIDVYNVISALTETIRISTTGYLTSSSDVYYTPVLKNSISFTESISVEGDISVSYGDLQIDNRNGQYDDWLDASKFIWVNRAFRLYYGDPGWISTNQSDVYTKFKLILVGTISDIDSQDRSTLNLKFRDYMDRLNTPITESVIGTTGTWASGQTNQEELRPLIFGEVFNISPVLLDPPNRLYTVHNGEIEDIIEIRDNGVPVYISGSGTVNAATINTSAGTFTLNRPAVGQVTASVQGAKRSINLANGNIVEGTYVNNIANIIALIARAYGDTINAKNLSNTELDLTNLTAFSSANTQKIGVYVSDRTNVLEICKGIASSIGAQVYFSRIGKLQLLRLGVISAPVMVVDNNDMFKDSFQLSEKLPVRVATKIAYAKNWTVQTNLLTAIPDAHKDSFSTEWLFASSTDATYASIKALYKLNGEPTEKSTYIVDLSSAESEANRLTTYFSTPRKKFAFKGRSKLLSLNLGDTITLQYPRFGLASGVSAQVISLSPNWGEGTVEVEVIL